MESTIARSTVCKNTTQVVRERLLALSAGNIHKNHNPYQSHVLGSHFRQISLKICTRSHFPYVNRKTSLNVLSVGKDSLSNEDASSYSEEISEGSVFAEARRKLSASFEQPAPIITGQQLRELVFKKYGRSYDMKLCKFNNRVYFQIMWKHLEQKSFHLTESMYMERLDAIAEFLNIWGVADRVREVVMKTRERPGYTGGGGAKAVSIPLGISRGEGRGAEWMDHF